MYDLARPQIEASRRAQELARLTAALGDLEYDNDPLTDVVRVQDAELLGTTAPLTVHRVRRSGASVALLMHVVIVSHIILLGSGFFKHVGEIGNITNKINSGLQSDLSTIGVWGILLILLRAYSLGGGTYTGIKQFQMACKSCGIRKSKQVSEQCYIWQHRLLLLPVDLQ